MHVLVEDEAEKLLGAAPCYLKSHSMGEYVFDHSWADAYTRAGGRYYPKLQVSVPFTPVTGPRLLVSNGARAAEIRAMLIAGLRALRDQTGASSIHATFLPQDDVDALARAGLPRRNDQQFHWFNDGYGSFEDFLGALSSRKRKAIRRERRDALANGVTIEWVTGTRHHRGALGRLLRLLHGYGLAQMGPALSQPQLLLAYRRAHGGARASRDGQARRPHIAGAINLIGDTRSTAATGAASRITPSCISRSATTRPSTSPSPAG